MRPQELLERLGPRALGNQELAGLQVTHTAQMMGAPSSNLGLINALASQLPQAPAAVPAPDQPILPDTTNYKTDFQGPK